MKRDVAQTIFRTVVFAGAMLGSAACHKAKPPVAPTNTNQQQTQTPDPNAKPADPNAKQTEGGDPCAGPSGDRPRGTDDDGGGGTGRGFVLS